MLTHTKSLTGLEYINHNVIFFPIYYQKQNCQAVKVGPWFGYREIKDRENIVYLD